MSTTKTKAVPGKGDTYRAPDGRTWFFASGDEIPDGFERVASSPPIPGGLEGTDDAPAKPAGTKAAPKA
ncbi:MAG: hypothetical protein M0P31_19020 [Solirubrobacteraceae bacterium]|nr:hypothetical protein [Solirubrobacteraceae bacterium]